LAGLYSSILPLLIYALFGSSRQLIVGPDAATCAVLAAVVADDNNV
jgi:MFS superfamily sulfate permease-like transporter